MKGKGKAMSDKDCPLQFPDLQPVDHAKQCPKYNNILSRGEDDSIGMEELDIIQTDVETLLASAGKRLRQLETEIQILVNWQDKKEKKSTTPGKTPDTPTSGKRGKVADDKPSKKFKESSGKCGSTPVGPGRPKSKNISVSNTPIGPGRPKNENISVKVQDYDFTDSPADLPKVTKNDAVNRFWLSLEPYCADITNDDLKVLEDALRSHEDDAEYFKVPTLGKHYSERWAEEDLLEEQREGSKINDKQRNTNNNSMSNSGDCVTLLRRAEQRNVDESPFGPLTQRLVSALIEENIMTPMDDTMAEIVGGKESPDEAPAISPKILAKQLNIGNPIHLEKRIKRELEEQGILDCDEKIEDNPDDEILTQLRQKQQELRALSQHNIVVTKQLLKKAKEEMARQEMKKKLIAADAEVMEAYRKIQLAKTKKKTPTKKEREAVYKALKERESILKIIDT